MDTTLTSTERYSTAAQGPVTTHIVLLWHVWRAATQRLRKDIPKWLPQSNCNAITFFVVVFLTAKGLTFIEHYYFIDWGLYSLVPSFFSIYTAYLFTENRRSQRIILTHVVSVYSCCFSTIVRLFLPNVPNTRIARRRVVNLTHRCVPVIQILMER